MSDYKEGFQDGYKFAREELMEKLREIDIRDIDSWLLNQLADMIEAHFYRQGQRQDMKEEILKLNPNRKDYGWGTTQDMLNELDALEEAQENSKN